MDIFNQNARLKMAQTVKLILNKINSYSLPFWTVPGFLGIIVLLSFGLVIRQVGFYWDDWPFLLTINQSDPADFVTIVGPHRPLLALLYKLTTLFFGDHPLRWQLFGLLCRWFAAVAVWWTFSVVWPNRKFQVASIAIIFSVYPGFLQQYISIVYSHYFLIYGLFILSLGIMVSAIRKDRWHWWGLSVIISGYCMFSIQYFVGLEIGRLLLIWFALSDTNHTDSIRKRIIDLIKYWSPYLGLLVIMIIWRFNLLPVTSYQPSVIPDLIEAPMVVVSNMLQRIIQDAFEVSFVAWLNVLNIQDLLDISSEFQRSYTWLVIIIFLIVFVYLWKIPKDNNQQKVTVNKHENQWVNQAISLGALMVFGAGWPYWIVPLEAGLIFPMDRLTLPMMIGTSILLIGVLEFTTKAYSKKIIILAVVLGFAAGFHYKISYTYKLERLDQERFLWQFAWRIPSLKPGTAILTDDFPFIYTDDEAITAAINFMYGTNLDHDLPNGFFVLSETLGDEMADLAEDSDIKGAYGLYTFRGSTSQAIAVYVPKFSCLRVLNPSERNFSHKYPGLLPEIISYSDQRNILIENRVEDQNIIKWFGPLSNLGWCYYFEKADLARQIGDWEQVVILGDQAFGKGIKYLAPEELYPFIEGYAQVGNIERAYQLTEEVRDISKVYVPELCGIWENTLVNISPGTSYSDVSEISDGLGCYR
jgi:hypothetical protein